MNLLIDIGHPGHVHLFKKLSDILRKNGYNVYVSTKNNRSITSLLNAYGQEYTSLGKKQNGILLKYLMSSLHLVRMWNLVRSKKINAGIGVSGLLPFISGYTSLNSICLDDDDSSVTPLYARSIRNADVILTPSALRNDHRGVNHITYEGYHELAYLHPNQFTPNPVVLTELGIGEGEQFFLLRFNAFKAQHDVGEHGLNKNQKRELINFLEPYGRVFISSEIDDVGFQKHKLSISPEKIHSVLYYTTLFIGDSQTMTSEAAVLGTPALKCNTFAKRLSIPNELEEKYGLCYAYKPEEFNVMLQKAKELLSIDNLQEEFQSRRQKMLSEKIDVTAFMVWFIENYPESIKIMKENPGYQYRFR